VEIGDHVPLPRRRQQDLCGIACTLISEDLMCAGATHDASTDKGERSVESKKAGSFCPKEIDLHT
jgi:hypothetical protein